MSSGRGRAPPAPDPAPLAGRGDAGDGRDPSAARHPAFLPADALALDLSDPQQREFGDYELLEQLGSGGMGVVYRARQRSLDREVAVKLLAAGPWASQEFVERFRREAQAAARLQHPNIVAIHEIGSRDELDYFSMALVRGPNLAQLVARNGPMAPREAARLVRSIADALHYAHRLGVLHLDLKPGNVLIDAQGEPQVADFGLSRRIDGAAIDLGPVSGTPSYMAPEQIDPGRHGLGVPTDIYGLGAILYELLTGEPPFNAASPDQTLALARDGRLRRPRRYRPDLPLDLEAICIKCLAREPGGRYPHAQALADDLGRFLDGRAVRVRPLNCAQRLHRWVRREPRLAGTIALAVLALLAGLGGALFQRGRAEASAAAAREQTWRTRGDAAWRLVAEGRNVEAMPLLLDNLRERQAHGDAAGAALERMRLGTLRQAGAQAIDIIATGGVGRALDLDRAGDRVAVIDMDETVRLYSTRDGRLLWQAATAGHAHFRAAGLPPTRVRFSADGRRLVGATLEPPGFLVPHGRNQVLIEASDGRILAPPADAFPDLLDATIDGTGRHALLRSTRGAMQLFQVDGWRPRTPPRPMASAGGSWMLGDDGRFVAHSLNHRIELLDPDTLAPRIAHRFEAAGGPTHWAAQPGGGLLALGHADGAVRLLEGTGPGMRELRPAPPRPVAALEFSGDGRWLLAAAGGEVYLWEVASGLGGPLPARRAIHATRLQADAATGTVFAFAPGDAMLWRLPDDVAADGGSADLRARIAGAQPVASQFALGSGLPRNAAAYAPSANLAASVARDGRLRLWRWRDARPLQARAPVLAPEPLHFDGRHVVAVDGPLVRVLAIRDDPAAAPALAHPQAVSFAALTADGRTLVTVSGRQLRAFDWRARRLLFAPIVLDNSPQLVLPGPDSARLFTATGRQRNGRYQVSAAIFDLRDGRALARDVPLPGPLAGARFSRSGRMLLHWRSDQLQVRDAATLRAHGPVLRVDPPGDAPPVLAGPRGPIRDAAVSDDGRRVTVQAAAREPQPPRLLGIDVHSGRIVDALALEPGPASRLSPGDGDGYAFALHGAHSGTLQWVDARAGIRPFAHAGPPAAEVALAASADGRWLATATPAGVLLADRQGGEWASALLGPQLPLGDAVVQLAFASDHSGLLARSTQGRLLWWPLPETGSFPGDDPQPAVPVPPADTARDRPAAPLPARERARLRASDPGPPAARAAGPMTATAATTATTAAIAPAEPPAPGPGLLPVDLRPAYNRALDAAFLPERLLAGIPQGRQRLLDVDFDIDGVVMLAMADAPAAAMGLPAASGEVRPPLPRFAALHVLVGGCCPLPGHAGQAYAYLVLRYADGGRERVPIRHGREMWFVDVEPEDAGSARIAWTARPPGAPAIVLYAPRLANPHPGREVAGIAFEASEHFASGPLVFAATAEHDGGATIAATASADAD